MDADVFARLPACPCPPDTLHHLDGCPRGDEIARRCADLDPAARLRLVRGR